MKKRTVFLQPDLVSTYVYDDEGVIQEDAWVIKTDLPAGFLAYLDENTDAEFNLLIDLPEEECHQEGLASTSLRDRRFLIERLKRKRFDNALLSTASVTGRRSSAKLRISGVAAHENCADLMQQLKGRQISLREIHSPVTLMAAVAKLLSVGSGPRLVVFPLRGSWRLIAYVDSTVCFNRRISHTSDSESAVDLNASLGETLMYLQRQKIPGWSTPELIVIGQPELGVGLSMLDNSVLNKGLVTNVVRHETETSSNELSTTNAEALLVKAAFYCGGGYTAREYQKAYFERKSRNVCLALALCGVTGAASSVALANKITDSHDSVVDAYNNAAVAVADNVLDHQTQYEQPIEAVRQALVTARLVEKSAEYNPIEFLQRLSSSVNRYEEVSITGVQWEREDVMEENALVGALKSNADYRALQVDTIYSATVSGEVQGRPQVALKAFESFVENLRSANANPSVVVVETPFVLGGLDRTTESFLSDGRSPFLIELSNKEVMQ